MATQLQVKMAQLAAQRIAAQEAAGFKLPEPEGSFTAEERAELPMRTFVHQVAGANVILPNGHRMVFAGKTTLASEGRRGGFGYYVTNKPEEIEMLAYLVRVPTSQVTELVENKVTHTERMLFKPADPAIQQSADDAAKNAERFFNPSVSSVVENLGAHVASGMAADSKQQNQ